MMSNIEIYNEYNYIYPNKQPMSWLQFLIFFQLQHGGTVINSLDAHGALF